MKVKHLIEQQLKHGRGILTESCEGLTDQQRLIVEGIYNDLEILVEASLTPDQIQGVFGAVEKEVTAGGDNRTLAGLGVDAAKQVDQTIDNIGKWLQDTKPVQAFDQKFEDLKTKIAQKFPKVAAQAAKLGDWAKENPGKTAAIIGVLTTIAALGTGPVGGAIAGQILRGSAELLKGEKLSTAVGKGIKTAAYGAVAGWLLDGLGDWLEGLRAKVVPYDKVPGLVKIEVGMTKTLTAPGMRYEQSIHNIFVPADAAEGFQTIVDLARDGDVNAFNDISSYVDRFSIKEYLKDKAIQDAAAQALAQQNDAFLQSMKAANEVIRAAAQGAIAGKLDASQVKVDGQPMNAGQGQKENVYRQQRPLSEGQVYMLFARVLNEGPLDWLKKKAHNITTKLTADKLNSAWQKAGSPTDSEELRQFLTSQNISDDIINKVYDEMKIGAEPPGGDQEPPAGSAAMSYKEIKVLVPKLQKKEKQRLIAYLQKQLGIA